MTENETSGHGSADDIAAAIRRAEAAIVALRATLKSHGVDELGAKAVHAAAALLGEGEALVADNEILATAQKELRGVVRTSPLTALGLAFGAGVLIAWLVRG